MSLTKLPEQKTSRKGLSLRVIAGIVLAIILLFILIQNISFEEVISILQVTDLSLLLLAIVLNIIMLSLMAYRWYVLYAHEKLRLPYLSLLNASFIAIFFNNFLPSTIGGDAYRAYYVAKKNGSTGVTGALSIIFVDRVMGLIGLILVSFISVFLYDGDLLNDIGDIRIWIFLIGLGLTGILWMGLNKSTYRLIGKILQTLPLPKKDWFQGKLDMFEQHLTVYSAHRRLLFYSLLLSVALRSIWLLGCYILGQAFHFDLPILTYFVLIPIIEVIRMIPLTIQGLGIREGLFVLFFNQVGLTISEATVLGVVIYLLLNVNGIIGFGLYIWGLVISGRGKDAGEVKSQEAFLE